MDNAQGINGFSTLLSAFITNLGKYNEGELVGEWLPFPTTEEKMQETLQRIGIDGVRYEECFFIDYETNVDGLREHLPEYISLDELNYLAGALDKLDKSELEHFSAAIEYGDYAGSVQDLINLTQNLDCYDYYADIGSDEDLGYYWVEESGVYDTKQLGSLANYIDYESFGRDIRLEEGGCFAGGGYIRSTGDSFTEYYDGMEVPDEYCLYIEDWLENAEMDEEQNYNLIDGVINNKEPEKNKETEAEERPSLNGRLQDAKQEVAEKQEEVAKDKKTPRKEPECLE